MKDFFQETAGKQPTRDVVLEFLHLELGQAVAVGWASSVRPDALPTGVTLPTRAMILNVSRHFRSFARPTLEEAGWRRVTGHAEKPLAWSIWQIPAHSEWQGVLLAIESPNENEYLISVQVTLREQLSSQ